MADQKRESFRVEYPRSYYPTITINKQKFDIIDASEIGIKFYIKDNTSLVLGREYTSIIRFPDNEQFKLTARVIRIDSEFISLKLITPLPLRKIRAEHLYLIQNFSEKKQFQ